MKALLIDFGSTYTKVVLVNLDPPELIGTAEAPTTVETDLREGLEEALRFFSPAELEGIKVKRACSSAAGGLKIVAIGLVPTLTVKAAREAALGAGARVLANYSYTITDQEMDEIRELKPDLLLLAGGTDGGERQTILENAATIAASGLVVPVVYAGNKVAAARAVELLQGKVPRVVVTGNVMPEINTLNPDPARKAIRDLYLEEITKAKGLQQVQDQCGLAMPTPLAVMRGGHLLQQQWQKDVVMVDIGGATTDVHSFCDGKPTKGGVILKGLPEPFVKRTVEGDLGMRVSVLSLLNSVGEESIAQFLPFTPQGGEVAGYARQVHQRLDLLPTDAREEAIERALAISCIREAVKRHAGTLAEVYTPTGRFFVQKGKDLSAAEVVVGVGGVLAHAREPGALLEEALSIGDPLILTPSKASCYLDHNYVLSAIGLLSEIDRQAAVKLLEETLAQIGRCDA
jgi:uncharacterized protein (TIGR01319 family)